jgi:hypothetical protein
VVPGCAARPWLSQSAVSVQPQLAQASAAVENVNTGGAIDAISAALLNRFMSENPHVP